MKNNNSTIAAHNNTPTLAISDNRGLAIRALAYNRIHTSDAPEELITRNRYNAVGQLIASRDARLDSDNFRYQYPLGGAALRTDGVDNGTSMQLTNIEGRPVMSLDAKGTRSWVTYEPELGRPLAHQQQPEGGQKTVTDRFFYGENSAGHKAANINGQCIRHYDTAGLQQVDSLSISGVALQQQRQLLTDTLGPVNWFGEEQSWASRLRRESFVTRCTTDILGQLITQTDAKGHTQRMAYNRAGQLSGSWLTIKNGAEQVIVKSLDYSAAGQKLREESGNSVVTEYRYEAETQRLIGIKTTRPAIKEQPTLLQDLRYDYDPVGNILAIHNDAEATRFFRNQKIVPETTYRYDALYQLTEATGRESDSNRAQNASLPALSSLTDGNQYVNYTRRYSYDRAGNLLKIQHSGASQYSTNITISNISNHGIQQQDGLTAADIRCQFDAAGNQQQLQPGQPLQWDARHQLQQVTTVKRGAENTPNDDYEHYLYASDGMRVVKQSIQHTNNIRQISRVTYLPGLELRTQHNDSELMEDFQVITLGASGRAQVRVLLWEKGLPAGIDNGQLRYSFDNQIGSSLLELDNNGDIISQEEYYPFGGTALFAARNTIEAKYKTVRYSGKERDATGLYYYGFRYYMPWLGRWLNADPAGTIDGLNLYRMVRNNPISLMDEDGLAPNDQPTEKSKSRVNASYNRMTYGSIWQESEWYNMGKGGYEAFDQQSIYNMSALEKDILPLIEDEQKFFDAYAKEYFEFTHFTDKPIHSSDGNLTLRSRDQLLKRNIIFNEENTHESDQLHLKTDDFVFLSLGTENTNKKTSRFGSHKYTIPAGNLADNKYGSFLHVTLNDTLFFNDRKTTKYPNSFTAKDINILKNEEIAEFASETIFTIADSIDALALRMIKSIRLLSNERQRELLATNTTEGFDILMNTLYRPQVLVPRKLALEKGQYTYTKPPVPQETKRVWL